MDGGDLRRQSFFKALNCCFCITENGCCNHQHSKRAIGRDGIYQMDATIGIGESRLSFYVLAAGALQTGNVPCIDNLAMGFGYGK